MRKLSIASQGSQGSSAAEILIDLSEPQVQGIKSDLYRTSSIRSTGSNSAPSPLADFQSDNVLNRASLKPRHLAPFPSPPASVSSTENRLAWDEVVGPKSGARTPTYSGGYNPFAAPGLDKWTRETWAKRKVALISGITGQGEYHVTCSLPAWLIGRWIISNRKYTWTSVR